MVIDKRKEEETQDLIKTFYSVHQLSQTVFFSGKTQIMLNVHVFYVLRDTVPTTSHSYL